MFYRVYTHSRCFDAPLSFLSAASSSWFFSFISCLFIFLLVHFMSHLVIVSWDHPVLCLVFMFPRFSYSIPITAAHMLISSISRYLTDSSHRETFESAHSVVLAIFASHAQQQQTSHPLRLPETSNRLEANHNLTLSTELSGRLRGARDYQLPESSATSSANPEDGQATFVQQTIPFYAQCLIKVSSSFVTSSSVRVSCVFSQSTASSHNQNKMLTVLASSASLFIEPIATMLIYCSQ